MVIKVTTSMAPLDKRYEVGLQITSLEGLLLQRGGKFFWNNRLVDWDFIGYQTLNSILLAIKLGFVHVARAKSREQRLIEKNMKRKADASGRLRTSKHS